MKIRYARMSDLAAIIALETLNFPAGERIEAEVIAFQLRHAHQSCLVMEENGVLLAYLLAVPVREEALTDEIFTCHDLPQEAAYLGVACLSVAPTAKGQGLGTLLLAALKEVAVEGGYQAISLTCHEELIGYYAANGFSDMGESASKLGGQIWYDMTWEVPQR